MSTLKITNIQKLGETASRDVSGVAAAWVNFNGTGTVAVRDSMNVSGLVDNGVGNYTVSFTNSMVADYSATVAVRNEGGAVSSSLSAANVLTDEFGIYAWNSAPATVDVSTVCGTVQGDLA